MLPSIPSVAAMPTSPVAILNDSSITVFETTYPYIASAYGIAVGVCFGRISVQCFPSPMAKAESVGLCGSRNPVGHVGDDLHFPLDDRRLALWVFFPVGWPFDPASTGLIQRQPRKRFQQQEQREPILCKRDDGIQRCGKHCRSRWKHSWHRRTRCRKSSLWTTRPPTERERDAGGAVSASDGSADDREPRCCWGVARLDFHMQRSIKRV